MIESLENISISQEPKFGTEKPPAFTGITQGLGASAQEDADALQDDLEKASDVAASMQRTLRGKCDEITHLKLLVEQSRVRFGHLQDAMTTLRSERHRLANEAMRAIGWASALKEMTAERDRLKVERDGVLQGLADEAAGKHLLRFDKEHVQIVELTVQVVKLKNELADARRDLERYTRPTNLKTSSNDYPTFENR